MDDKSINLWRQINAHRLSGGQSITLIRSNAELEGCRRAKKLLERRGKAATPLAGAAANDPIWTPREFKFR